MRRVLFVFAPRLSDYFGVRVGGHVWVMCCCDFVVLFFARADQRQRGTCYFLLSVGFGCVHVED